MARCKPCLLAKQLPPSVFAALLQGAIVDVCWARAAAPAGSDAAAGATLYSLSADGALLRWGPLPLPLSDLFTSRKGGSGGLAAAAASEASGGGGSWAAPGGKPSAAAAALASPADVRAQLAAAAAAKGGAVDAAAWLGILQDQPPPPITAFAMHAPPGEGPQGHLLAVAVQGGGVAVLSAVGPDAALLWASGGGGSGAPIR